MDVDLQSANPALRGLAYTAVGIEEGLSALGCDLIEVWPQRVQAINDPGGRVLCLIGADIGVRFCFEQGLQFFRGEPRRLVGAAREAYER